MNPLFLFMLLLPVCLLGMLVVVLFLGGRFVLMRAGENPKGKSLAEILRGALGRLKSTRNVEGEPILVAVVDYPGSPWFVPTAVLSVAIVVAVPLVLALLRIGRRDVTTLAASLASIVGAAVQFGSSELKKQTVRLVITDRGVHIKRRFKKKWLHAYKAQWNRIEYCENRRKGVRFVLKAPMRTRSTLFRADLPTRRLICSLAERFGCKWKELIEEGDPDRIA